MLIATSERVVTILTRPEMHIFWLFLVWMVYSILAIGVLEAYSERDANAVRGAGTAMLIGGILAVFLTVVILWFGPLEPW